MSKGSPGTCIPGGGVATFLLYAFTAHGIIPADDRCQTRILCGDAITTHADLLRGGWRRAVPWCRRRWPARCRCTRDRWQPGGCPWRGVTRGCRTAAAHRSIRPPRAASRSGPLGAGTRRGCRRRQQAGHRGRGHGRASASPALQAVLRSCCRRRMTARAPFLSTVTQKSWPSSSTA
jgi:hypothetical protein